MDFLESFDYLLELAERGRFIPTLDTDGRVAFIVHDRVAEDLSLFLSFHFSRAINIRDEIITIDDRDTFERLLTMTTSDKTSDALVSCSQKPEQLREQSHCFRKWSDLDLTDNDDIRFCKACEKPVYRVVDSMDLFEHVVKNHCIAFFNEHKDEEDFTVEVSFDVEDPNLYIQPHPQNPDYVHITQEGWWTWSTSMSAHDISPKRWFTRTEIEVIKLLDTLYHTLDDGDDNELLCNVAERARMDLREVNSNRAGKYCEHLERLINRQIEVDQQQNRDRFAEKDPEFIDYLHKLEEDAAREAEMIRRLEAGEKD